MTGPQHPFVHFSRDTLSQEYITSPVVGSATCPNGTAYTMWRLAVSAVPFGRFRS